MKTFCKLTFILICFSFVKIYGQAPNAIPFQAVARDNSGNLIANQVVSLRFSIHDSTTGGTVVYKETQNATTNALGLFNANIGQGVVLNGTFASINWAAGNKFMQVEMDVNGGSTYVDMGTQQMLSVPYALFARNSNLSSNGVPNGNANGNTLRWTGTSWVIDSTLTNKGTNVGIGNTTPNSSAALDVNSTTKGFLIPRMTTAQRNAIVSPAVGLQVFNTDDQCVDIFDGTNWMKSCGLKITGTANDPSHPSPNSWTQKPNFGGTAREGAIGFSIGSKGYIGTGDNAGGTNYNDFWEYDPTTNIWTQKANFGGTPRYGAVGFSIGSKGYIGTGINSSTSYNDFWEYDPTTNIWTQKANFGGTARYGAVGFSIGSKGYIGTGINSSAPYRKNDFWEYDPNNNTWTQKANFGGIARCYAAGFSIGTKGYIGTGEMVSGYGVDFWEYDPNNNIWTQKSNFGGGVRIEATGFSIAAKGYIGTGYNSSGRYNDFWEYDPSTNNWLQKSNFGGGIRSSAIGFSIGNKGYIGTGNNSGPLLQNDFWEYMDNNITGSAYLSNPVSSVNSISDGAWTLYNNTVYNSNNGNVGIGTNIPTATLSVNGSANKPGGGTWSAFSDLRLKKNLIPYKDGLNSLLLISPFKYHYNEISGYDTKPEYIGVVAQELKEIAPYMVNTFQMNGNDYLGVDNSAMIYMLINSIKEQQNFIDDLRKRIEMLEKNK